MGWDIVGWVVSRWRKCVGLSSLYCSSLFVIQVCFCTAAHDVYEINESVVLIVRT